MFNWISGVKVKPNARSLDEAGRIVAAHYVTNSGRLPPLYTAYPMTASTPTKTNKPMYWQG